LAEEAYQEPNGHRRHDPESLPALHASGYIAKTIIRYGNVVTLLDRVAGNPAIQEPCDSNEVDDNSHRSVPQRIVGLSIAPSTVIHWHFNDPVAVTK
jgi:hypothetical protein